MGFPGGGGPVVKDQLANAGDIRDVGSTSGLGRSPGGGHGNLPPCTEEPGGLQSMGFYESDTTEVS